MCLPYQFLKKYQCISSIIGIILSSAAMLIGIIMAIIQNSDFWNMTYFRWPIVSSVLMVLVGLLTLIYSIFGLIGYKKQRHGFNACYFYGICFSMICFLIIGIVTTVHVYDIGNQMNEFYQNGCQFNTNQYSLQWLNTLSQLDMTGQQTFGKSQGCEVYLDPQHKQALSSQLYYNTQTQLANNTNVKACIPYYYYWNNILDNIETNYQCSGFCQQYSYYIFSNVNNGYPSYSCFNFVYNEIRDFGYIIGISSICIASLLFVNLISQFCLCCHPQQQSEQDINPFFTQIQFMNTSMKLNNNGKKEYLQENFSNYK